MNKKTVLPLALLLVTLALTIAPAAGAHDHDSHVSNAPKRHRAKTTSARRPAKRRQKAQQPRQAMYTCPMHHEVRSKTAGECPKCKMELELEETSAKAKSE
ncbi:MAG TPA: heavy metal-binding domain-containing protein [Pyrinomonadaceae bacterium]